MRQSLLAAAALLAIVPAACAQPSPGNSPPIETAAFTARQVAFFDEPWAMTFLPDGRMLVTTKPGDLLVATQDGRKSRTVTGVPKVDYGGQGGLGDVILSPDFRNDRYIYLSYAEAGPNDTRGAAVARARLTLKPDAQGGSLDQVQVIWRQEPKVDGRGHYGHRLAFSPDGQYLFISSGERQKFTPAQDLNQNLGKIVRLTPTGGIPSDNPFYDQGRVKAQVWSYGHRNPLGIAFDARGRLWNQEMGPKGGDELNLVKRGANYGYPIVSNGDHYDGRPIPDHPTRPEFEAPKTTWNPVISPAGLVIYTGDLFPAWKGSAFIGGLSSEALVRVAIDGDRAREAERWPMQARIREIEQGPDGALWVLEDKAGARLLKLTPRAQATASREERRGPRASIASSQLPATRRVDRRECRERPAGLVGATTAARS